MFRNELLKIHAKHYGAENKLMEFSNKSYSPGADFLIDALLKENKQIVTEKYEFDYRDKAILLEFFE